MKISRTFNVELTEFAAQLIIWVGTSDDAQELVYSLIDEQLPDDADTAGLDRDEFVLALRGRFDTAIRNISDGLTNSRRGDQ